MCNVLPGRLPGERMDPAPSFNWSHILGLKHAGIERECAKEEEKKRHQSVEVDVTQLISNPDGFKRNLVAIKSSELNPTHYQIKQLYNADEC